MSTENKRREAVFNSKYYDKLKIRTSRNALDEKFDYEAQSEGKPFLTQLKGNSSETLINFIMYFKYINVIKSGKVKDPELEVTHILKKNEPLDHLPETADIFRFQTYYVIIKFRGNEIIMTLSSFIERGEMKYNIAATSFGKVNYDFLSIRKYIFFRSINHSNIKGKQIEVNSKLHWSLLPIEKRKKTDIFLPNKNFKDIDTYVNVFKKTNGKLLRYLFIGSPGTCKTETMLYISTELNKKGVTIMKTSVCESFGLKVELAKLLAPTLILLDDIDLSIGSRSRGSYDPNVLAAFLGTLDGTEKMPDDVGIVASSNSPELLDMAAQRPGRFDQIIYFNELTNDNIKDVVKKSLKKEYDINKNEEIAKIMSDDKVVSVYKRYNCTGSHIYNYTKMMLLNLDECEDVTPELVANMLKEDLETISKMKKKNFLRGGFGKNAVGEEGESSYLRRLKKDIDIDIWGPDE